MYRSKLNLWHMRYSYAFFLTLFLHLRSHQIFDRPTLKGKKDNKINAAPDFKLTLFELVTPRKI